MLIHEVHEEARIRRRAILLAAFLCLLLLPRAGALARYDIDRPATPAVEVEPLPPGTQIETVFSRISNPVSMAFTPDGQLLYTERTSGWVRLDVNGFAFPLFKANTSGLAESERGLIGIALDPNFASNGFVYLYYTSAEDLNTTGKYDNRVLRFSLSGSTAPTVLLKVPLESNTTLIHNGGNLRFGPDGKLYVSIGDYFNAANGQDPTRMPGKLHRFDASAPLSAPADNPFFDGAGPNADSVFARGFRNPFDFDFDPVTGALFASDNGVACDDEVNRVLPGYNYGWRSGYPICDNTSGDGPDAAFNTIAPLFNWAFSAVPTGVMFYHGNLFPEWKNDLFVCHWKSGELHHFKLNAARAAIVSHTILSDPVLGTSLCHVDIENEPSGRLYFIRNRDDDPGKDLRDILRLTRTATVYASTFSPSNSLPAAGETLTYTVQLIHYGTLTTTFAVTSSLAPSTTLVGSPQATGGAIGVTGAGITWTGSIVPNTILTATYRAAVAGSIAAPVVLSNATLISTDNAGSFRLPAAIVVDGKAVYLPVVLRSIVP